MSSKSFYVQRMKNLHSRYRLGNNAVRLLKGLDEYHMGVIDEDTLGRMVRFSPPMRTALTETIKKLAAMIDKKPEEARDCVALIQNCTEILTIADKPPALQGFSFMKLPKEIRHNVYDHYLNAAPRGVSLQHRVLARPSKSNACVCSNHDDFRCTHAAKLDLARTCKLAKDEFLAYYYRDRIFDFACPCELEQHLRTNRLLRLNIQRVKVHWTGPRSDLAFKLLRRCVNLRLLRIAISKTTTHRMSSRESMMANYFHSSRPARLSDALGLDELLSIRGITHGVTVCHISAKQGSRRTDEDRAALESLLADHLEKPAALEYSQGGDDSS